MQTLSLPKSLVSSFGHDFHYQKESQFQRQEAQPTAINKAVSKVVSKGLEVHRAKSDSAIEKGEWNKENVKPKQSRFGMVTSSSFKEIPLEDIPEREYFIRCVMIGVKSTGKHSLVHSTLQQAAGPYPKREADFIMKQIVEPKTTKKYHFWIRTLNEPSETKETIWKTYYKWATAFVFVYDITNKESFLALEKAVENVLRVIPKEKFFGILVGTKSDLYEHAAVDYDEAEAFKQKYHLSYLIETNSAVEAEMPELLPILDTRLKLTFEAI